MENSIRILISSLSLSMSLSSPLARARGDEIMRELDFTAWGEDKAKNYGEIPVVTSVGLAHSVFAALTRAVDGSVESETLILEGKKKTPINSGNIGSPSPCISRMCARYVASSENNFQFQSRWSRSYSSIVFDQSINDQDLINGRRSMPLSDQWASDQCRFPIIDQQALVIKI